MGPDAAFSPRRSPLLDRSRRIGALGLLCSSRPGVDPRLPAVGCGRYQQTPRSAGPPAGPMACDQPQAGHRKRQQRFPEGEPPAAGACLERRRPPPHVAGKEPGGSWTPRIFPAPGVIAADMPELISAAFVPLAQASRERVPAAGPNLRPRAVPDAAAVRVSRARNGWPALHDRIPRSAPGRIVACRAQVPTPSETRVGL